MTSPTVLHEFHPGHADQKVHGRRKAPATVSIPAPSVSAGSPSTFRELDEHSAQLMQDGMLKSSPWTRAQKKAIDTYTSNKFREMNGALRDPTSLDQLSDEDRKATVSAIRNLNNAMRPLPEGVRVFRATSRQGVGLPEVEGSLDTEKFGDVDLRGLIGKTMQNAAFSSTSVNKDQAADVNWLEHDILMEIEVPPGIPAAYVESISHNEGEQEMILAPGLKYEFVSAEKPYRGRAVVKVKVVP